MATDNCSLAILSNFHSVVVVRFGLGFRTFPYVSALVVAPVGGFGDNALESTHRLRNRLITGANHVGALLTGAHSIHHLLAELHHSEIARAKAVFGAVGDRAHGDPHGDILIRKAGD